MITVRPSEERGHFDHGWLETRHTFSFAAYHDPNHMGFRTLRVINEDRVLPGEGFGTHPHRDMEIITYIVEGALEHKDSMGNGSVIRAGDVQRMTAGTGVTHSEFNPSSTDPVHLLQIWILPERNGLEPGYEQKEFPADSKRGTLRLIASPDGRDGSLTIRQDAEIHASILEAGGTVGYEPALGRHLWIQVVKGSLAAGGTALGPGDGAIVTETSRLDLKAEEEAEFLLFDLA